MWMPRLRKRERNSFLDPRTRFWEVSEIRFWIQELVFGNSLQPSVPGIRSWHPFLGLVSGPSHPVPGTRFWTQHPGFGRLWSQDPGSGCLWSQERVFGSRIQTSHLLFYALYQSVLMCNSSAAFFRYHHPVSNISTIHYSTCFNHHEFHWLLLYSTQKFLKTTTVAKFQIFRAYSRIFDDEYTWKCPSIIHSQGTRAWFEAVWEDFQPSFQGASNFWVKTSFPKPSWYYRDYGEGSRVSV